VFHLIQGESKLPNFIDHPIEKTGGLLNRLLEAQFDDPVNHSGVVNIDPECEPLTPVFQGTKIQRSKPSCEIFISFKCLRAPDSSVFDYANLRVDKVCLKLSQGKG
jgi:hypothetical protein